VDKGHQLVAQGGAVGSSGAPLGQRLPQQRLRGMAWVTTQIRMCWNLTLASPVDVHVQSKTVA
jgi:hypothetical protein